MVEGKRKKRGEEEGLFIYLFNYNKITRENRSRYRERATSILFGRTAQEEKRNFSSCVVVHEQKNRGCL